MNLYASAVQAFRGAAMSDQPADSAPAKARRRKPAAPGAPPEAQPVLLSDALRGVVDGLLFSDGDSARGAVVERIAALPEQERAQVGLYLIQQLKNQPDGMLRSWMISAIAAARPPEAAEALSRHLDKRYEEDNLVRFWAAIRLAQLGPENLKERLNHARRYDEDAQVVAVALRLLIESGYEDSYFEEWQKMAEADDWYSRFAACKVLRKQYGLHSLAALETRFLAVLKQRIGMESETLDVKYQAALALGDFQQQWSAAVDLLDSLLALRADWLRRGAVDALCAISRPETRQPLFRALSDSDAEIRYRAAAGLKKALGTEAAVSFIIDHILQEDKPAPQFLDALRQIDAKAAADVLSNRLLSPDPLVSNRAQALLTHLGGEGAFRSLLAQRNSAINAYAAILKETDERITAQFTRRMADVQQAYHTSLWMHRIIFGIGVLILAASLVMAAAQGLDSLQGWVGVGGAASGLGTLLLVFYASPLKNIDRSVSQLIKIDVIFLGYIRQLNQIDATFKQLFLATMSFGTDQMEKTVGEIRTTVDRTMNEIQKNVSQQS